MVGRHFLDLNNINDIGGMRGGKFLECTSSILCFSTKLGERRDASR